jgi:hypothetical protein
MSKRRQNSIQIKDLEREIVSRKYNPKKGEIRKKVSVHSFKKDL